MGDVETRTALFIRHAPKAWSNTEGLALDMRARALDPPIVATSPARVTAVRAMLPPGARLLSSPYLRARQTASLLGAGAVSEPLAGEYLGHQRPARSQVWRKFFNPATVRWNGGVPRQCETMAEFRARAAALAAAVLSVGQNTVVVTHGLMLRCVAGGLLATISPDDAAARLEVLDTRELAALRVTFALTPSGAFGHVIAVENV
jgi:broad specificity phosphatase PhoE